MDQITQAVEPLRQFGKDSIRLVKRCTKPDRYTNSVIQERGQQKFSFFTPVVKKGVYFFGGFPFTKNNLGCQ